jgi:predicted dehydrogenase
VYCEKPVSLRAERRKKLIRKKEKRKEKVVHSYQTYKK